jgi:hypothetical protein
MFERTQTDVEQFAPDLWFGVWQPVEPLAASGSVVLWRATDGHDRSALLRLYPSFRGQYNWRHFKTAAARRARLGDDPQLLAIRQVGSYGRPHLLLDDPVGEPLATRVERESLPPELALRVFADVAVGLELLAAAGVPALDLSPADVFIAGDRGLLLADAGLLSEALGGRCLATAHVAPERARTAQPRLDGGAWRALARVSYRHAPRPTAASMTYSFASLLTAALAGPAPRGANRQPATERLPVPARRALERALAGQPWRRHRSPTKLVAALRQAFAEDEALDAGRAAPATVTANGARSANGSRPSNGATAANGAAAPTRGGSAGRRPVARRTLALGAAAVAVAALAGAAAGIATTAPDPPPAATLARAGLSVTAPAGWTLLDRAAAPFDAGTQTLTAQAPGGRGDARLTVTRAAAPLLTAVAGRVPDAVELRAGPAWRYAEVPLRGTPADVYVLASDGGPVVAACRAPTAELRAACARVVTTLRLAGAAALPLGGGAATRRQATRALAALARSRSTDRGVLAQAPRPRGQALAAARLADAHASAAAAVVRAGAVGPPGTRARLVANLRTTGRSYAALAAAARSGDGAAYAAARRQIERSERTLRRSLVAASRAPAP